MSNWCNSAVQCIIISSLNGYNVNLPSKYSCLYLQTGAPPSLGQRSSFMQRTTVTQKVICGHSAEKWLSAQTQMGFVFVLSSQGPEAQRTEGGRNVRAQGRKRVSQHAATQVWHCYGNHEHNATVSTPLTGPFNLTRWIKDVGLRLQLFLYIKWLLIVTGSGEGHFFSNSVATWRLGEKVVLRGKSSRYQRVGNRGECMIIHSHTGNWQQNKETNHENIFVCCLFCSLKPPVSKI